MQSLYTKGKEKIMRSQIDLVSDTIKVILLANTYTVNLATDEFLSNIEAHRLSSDVTLAGKSVAGGAWDANDIVFPAVVAGHKAKAIAFYKDTGTASTSALIHYTEEITGFPLDTNGGNIGVDFDNGVNKIFSL